MNNVILESLWNLYQSEYAAKPNKEINEYFRISEQCPEKLLKDMPDDKKQILETYYNSIQKMECIMERDAFVQGVKFTAGFLVEALNNE